MRTARPPPLQGSGRGTNGDLRLHRGLVQSAPPPLRPRLSFTDQLRKDSATTEFNRKPNTVHRSGVAPDWLERWSAEVADLRIHGTTHERPLDRFAREQLTPLGTR